MTSRPSIVIDFQTAVTSRANRSVPGPEFARANAKALELRRQSARPTSGQQYSLDLRSRLRAFAQGGSEALNVEASRQQARAPAAGIQRRGG